MGWMKDDGLSLLVETLHFTHPTLVIQFFGSRQSHVKHIPMLTPEFLANAPRLSFALTQGDGELKPHHRWIRLTSETPNDRTRDSRSNATSRRDLALLAYLGQITAGQPTAGIVAASAATTLRAVTPYRVRWTDVAVHVCHEAVPNSQILYALNGSLVALCIARNHQMFTTNATFAPRLLHKDALIDCLGYGIVRSIDATDRSLYILTPVAPSVLETVNCLCRGAINIPGCILLSAAEPAACVEPYVDHLPKLPHVRRRRRKPQSHKVVPQSTSCVVIVDTRQPDTSLADNLADTSCDWMMDDSSVAEDDEDEN
jgi:polynucleotide 5'-hydroxyl-kinase GRC3/NOL9